MSDDLTDIKVTLARVTTTLEGVGTILKRHEDNHADHYKATSRQGSDIAKMKGIAAVLSFMGLSGLAALFKA